MMQKRYGEHESLSPAGLARRAEMLEVLQREVSRRRKRRTHARRGLAAAAIAIGILVLLDRFETQNANTGRVVDVPLPPPQTPAPDTPPLEERLKSIRFEVVRAQPDVAERWSVQRKPRDVKVLSDDDLLRELAAADVPSGLIRLPEGYILTADVTRRARRG